jgi:hypothetical protein
MFGPYSSTINRQQVMQLVVKVWNGKILVISVNCNQIFEENTLVLTKCFHYCKQLDFCDGVSCLRISKFPWIAVGVYFEGNGDDKICMMTTRLACNWAIESSYWRMDNDSDVGLLTDYVLYWLRVELEFMDLDTFPRWFRLHPSLHTSW